MSESSEKTKRVLCGVSIGLFVTFFGLALYSVPAVKNLLVRNRLEKVQSFNQLEIGGEFRFGIQLCSQKKDRAELSPPRFTVYVIGDVNQICCNDLECSSQAHEVLKNGGRLVGTNDMKLGKIMGIPIINTGQEWKLTDSIMIVEDNLGKVRAIFRNAQFNDVSAALKQVKL